jgi:hypothetical protein
MFCEKVLEGMNWKQHLQRMMGAVIVMIACLVASPAAYAHSGHEHFASSVANTDVAPVMDAATPVEGQQAALASVYLKAQASPAIPAPKSKRCTGGCCTSSHACCVVNLPVPSGATHVPAISAVRAFLEPPLRDGLDPEALRKPPRSLV